MKHLKTLSILIIICITTMFACEKKKSPKNVTGTVIKVDGNALRLVKSDGAVFGNESVKLGNPTLIYHVQVGNEVYIISIKKQDSGRDLALIAASIKKGDVVRFPTGGKYHNNHDGCNKKSKIEKDNIGWVDSDYFKLVKKGK